MSKRETADGGASVSGEGDGGFWSRFPVLVLMILVFLVAGILSAVTAMKFVIQGREVEVPDLTGIVEASASDLLGERGLDLIVDGRRFSSQVPEAAIMDQSPPPGSRVKRERSVRVRISLGDREYAVPELRGSSLRSGELQLVQRGLAVGATLYVHTGQSEPGTVVFQRPEPGDVGESDPAVSVLVSLGGLDQYFVMPPLTGLSIGDARTRVRASGFRATEVQAGEQPGVPAGRVISQQPARGHRISRTETIVLGVSQ